jgi:hypothetical protein
LVNVCMYLIGTSHFIFLHSKILSLTLRESEKYVKTRSTETVVAVATITTTTTTTTTKGKIQKQ